MKTTRRSLLGMILAAATTPVLAKAAEVKPLILDDIRPKGVKIRQNGVSGVHAYVERIRFHADGTTSFY